jgi:hypothetical protein
MLICLGGGGILGLHDLRIVPLKPGWREYYSFFFICICLLIRILFTVHTDSGAKLPVGQGRAVALPWFFANVLRCTCFFWTIWVIIRKKTDFVWENYARFSKYCGKLTSQQKHDLDRVVGKKGWWPWSNREWMKGQRRDAKSGYW